MYDGGETLGVTVMVSIIPYRNEFYVYVGSKLVRVCPSIGMAREVAAAY